MKGKKKNSFFQKTSQRGTVLVELSMLILLFMTTAYGTFQFLRNSRNTGIAAQLTKQAALMVARHCADPYTIVRTQGVIDPNILEPHQWEGYRAVYPVVDGLGTFNGHTGTQRPSCLHQIQWVFESVTNQMNGLEAVNIPPLEVHVTVYARDPDSGDYSACVKFPTDTDSDQLVLVNSTTCNSSRQVPLFTGVAPAPLDENLDDLTTLASEPPFLAIVEVMMQEGGSEFLTGAIYERAVF